MKPQQSVTLPSVPKEHSSNFISLTELSVDELDLYAWEAICNWPEYTDVQIMKDELNYAELTRYFLWDKVGRAIRREIDSEGVAFEANMLDQNAEPKTTREQHHTLSWIKEVKTPIRSAICWGRDTLNDLGIYLELRWQAYLKKAQILYVPYPSPRLENAVVTLAKSRFITLLDRNSQLDGYDRSYQTKMPQKIEQPDLMYTERLFQGILKGLRAQRIELLTSDSEHLRNQIVQQARQVNLAKAELCVFRPDGVLVHGDNHPPHQNYVLVARRDGVPSIMIQHGLDCERYYHDDAYASTIAVWGKARVQRYQQDSKRQPDFMNITGNPQYDHLSLPEKIDSGGKYWLWVTRPHMPDKCYAPSRRPQEGLDILEALLSALIAIPNARLVIKPHPYDYANLYQDYIARSEVADRVKILNTDVQTLIPGTKTVISEDSTAGMEAMFGGKVVVHVHFAESSPTMPFVEYMAALPAFSAEMLQESLRHAECLTPGECNRMIEGQREFITDHAGPCDGEAAQRVISFISDVLLGKVG